MTRHANPVAPLFAPPPFDTTCTIEIEHTQEHLHAHCALAGDIALNPGDRVRVHGAPVRVPFGERLVIERPVTVRRAGLARRQWTRLAAMFDLSELYEVSFSPRRLP